MITGSPCIATILVGGVKSFKWRESPEGLCLRSTLPLGCGCPRRGFAVFRMVTSPVRNLQRFAMHGLFGKRGITEKPPYVGLTRRLPSCDTFFYATEQIHPLRGWSSRTTNDFD